MTVFFIRINNKTNKQTRLLPITRSCQTASACLPARTPPQVSRQGRQSAASTSRHAHAFMMRLRMIPGHLGSDPASRDGGGEEELLIMDDTNQYTWAKIFEVYLITFRWRISYMDSTGADPGILEFSPRPPCERRRREDWSWGPPQEKK